MTELSSVDLAAVIERQPFNRFALVLLGASMLTTFFDGFDLMALSYVAPYLATEYGLDARALGNLFSIGLAGTMIGALVATWLGDRFGRRPALLWSTLAFGILTTALAFASSVEAFFTLRFLQGMALAGALPLLWALNIEYTPRRRRATITTLVTLGFGLGSALAGPITVGLMRHFDWHAVFAFGGIASIALSLLLWRVLPESLRYLVQHRREPAQIARAMRRFAPDEMLPTAAHFTLSDESESAAGQRPSLSAIFAGDLRLITPLIWVAYLASSIATYLLATWGPILFELFGFNREAAAYVASGNAFVGMLGGLALMRFTDRFGVVAVAVMPALAVPVLLALGLASFAPVVFIAVNLFLAAVLTGGHYGVMSIIGLFYPSATRASAAGAASTVGKIGSILGPQLGGFLLASHLPATLAFAAIAVCPLILSGCMVAVALAQRRAAYDFRGPRAIGDPSSSSRHDVGARPNCWRKRRAK